MLKTITKVVVDKKAGDVAILDVRGLASYTDYFLLVSGIAARQVRAMANALLELPKKGADVQIVGSEGLESAKWVLIDFGDVVAHLFFEPVRAFYDLEGLWVDAPRLDVKTLLEECDAADDAEAS